MAVFIRWDPGHSVGIEQIDANHRWLVNLINELYDNLLNGGGESIEDIAGRLVEYVDEHFALEQRLMRDSGYPGAQEHENEHRKAARMIREFNEQAQTGDPPALFDILEYLVRWLYGHIADMDRRMGEYLKACAQTGEA